jgi:5-aminolevulinate synthase
MPNVIIYSDELNHASMIEGIKRALIAPSASSATTIRATCAPAGERSGDAESRRLRVSLFDGRRRRADGEICDLAQEFDALTYLDEVHAVGMYGAKARASPSAMA